MKAALLTASSLCTYCFRGIVEGVCELQSQLIELAYIHIIVVASLVALSCSFRRSVVPAPTPTSFYTVIARAGLQCINACDAPR